MSRLIFDKKDRGPLKYVDESEWTTARLKDEFFLCLVKTPNQKYYEQAKKVIFRIPITEQYPNSEEEAVAFTINFSDLSSKVQSEFAKYCITYHKKEVTIFLKEIVIRLFENLDYAYAHTSIMRKLRVRIVNS